MKEEPTEAQIQLADALGVQISGSSRAIAAAKLRAAVAPALNLDSRPATEKQIAFASKLGIDVRHQSVSVARECIGAELTVQNIISLQRLSLRLGDRILILGQTEPQTVSCVGRNNKVFLKGAGGISVWPSQISKIVKRSN
jgi:hypothetical protein